MAKPTPEGFYIKPVVFKVPQAGVEPDYLSVMMPFRTDFNPVYKAIEKAAKEAGFRVQRADKVWEDQIIVEDVFSMIYRSAVVVCDFSGKNPNVMYEAGIAHTLGRTVVPITQVETDLPFDIRHHRALPYENHSKGRTALKKQLITRFKMLALSGATKQ